MNRPCKTVNVFQGAVIPYSGESTYRSLGIDPPSDQDIYSRYEIPKQKISKVNNFVFGAELEIEDLTSLGGTNCICVRDTSTGFKYYIRDIDIIKRTVNGRVQGNWTFSNNGKKYFLISAT